MTQEAREPVAAEVVEQVVAAKVVENKALQMYNKSVHELEA